MRGIGNKADVENVKYISSEKISLLHYLEKAMILFMYKNFIIKNRKK